MAVSVPNKVGTHSSTDTPLLYTKQQVRKWNTGIYYGPVQQFGVNGPTWASEKPPIVAGQVVTINGKPFRKPTTYSRNCRRYSFRPSTYTTPWYYMGQYNGGPYYDQYIYTGVNFGSSHIGDASLPNMGGLDEQGLVAQSKTECLLKLHKSGVDMGQYMAEALKTAETVASSSEQLLNLLLLVKRKQWSRIPKDFGTYVDAAGNGWLQWQYGWKPFCSDLYTLYQGFQTDLSRGPMIFSATRNVGETTGGNYSLYGHSGKYSKRTRATTTLYAKLSNAYIGTLQQYGLINPLSLAWELIPRSFVVDWFMPIGNTLASLSAPAGLDFVSGSTSVTREGEVTLNSNTCGSMDMEQLSFYRLVHTNWPITLMPYAKKNPLSFPRIASTLALLNQLRR